MQKLWLYFSEIVFIDNGNTLRMYGYFLLHKVNQRHEEICLFLRHSLKHFSYLRSRVTNLYEYLAVIFGYSTISSRHRE